MTHLRRAVLRAVIACSAVALSLAAGPGADAPTPVRTLALETIATAPANRAAVIIDKGDGSAPRKACIRFDANSISGEEALRLAAAQDPSIAPVFADFSGKGKAVCALCGTGCPAGDCLTCDPTRFWAYHRAEAGAGSFTISPVGVSSTQVTDGDVEGYRWGSGAAPVHADIQSICGEVAPPPPPPPPPSPPPPAPPPSPAAPSPAPAPGPVPPPAPAPANESEGGPTTAPPAPAPPTESAQEAPPDPPTAEGDAPTTTTTSAEEGSTTTETSTGDRRPTTSVDGDDAGDDEAAVRLTTDGETGGGSGLAVAGVGATFAAMIAGAIGLQRARRRS